MTAAGQAQAAAAQAIAPALAAFNRSLARTRNAEQAECARIASNLHGCLGTLATAVNSTGYAASGQWRGEFLQGQASDPDWLNNTAHAAAQRIQDAANLTIAIRAVRLDGASVTLPVMRAGHVLWKACHDLDQLILEHRRAGTMPQVPDYAAVLGGLQAACEPLAAAVDALAPRLAGIDPDPLSVWCEDFAGDLPAAYRDAACQCRAGNGILRSVRDQAVADVRTWRSGVQAPATGRQGPGGPASRRSHRMTGAIASIAAAADDARWQQFERAATQGDAR
jgi:hypothetical protein